MGLVLRRRNGTEKNTPIEQNEGPEIVVPSTGTKQSYRLDVEDAIASVAVAAVVGVELKLPVLWRKRQVKNMLLSLIHI